VLSQYLAKAREIDEHFQGMLNIRLEQLLDDISRYRWLSEAHLDLLVKNTGHGLEHALKTVEVSLELAKLVNQSGKAVNCKIVALAAFFHDFCSPIDRKQHEEKGVELAKEILGKPKIALQKGEMKIICHAILYHDNRTGLSQEYLESQIVYDADRIIETVDIERIVLVSLREVGRKFFNPDLSLQYRLDILSKVRDRSKVEAPQNDALMFLLRNVTTGLTPATYTTEVAIEFIRQRNLLQENRKKILDFAMNYDPENKNRITSVVDEVICCFWKLCNQFPQ
jgi:HD superfamily phosphodiesterase